MWQAVSFSGSYQQQKIHNINMRGTMHAKSLDDVWMCRQLLPNFNLPVLLFWQHEEHRPFLCVSRVFLNKNTTISTAQASRHSFFHSLSTSGLICSRRRFTAFAANPTWLPALPESEGSSAKGRKASLFLYAKAFWPAA
jgi:hypothetical protein